MCERVLPRPKRCAPRQWDSEGGRLLIKKKLGVGTSSRTDCSVLFLVGLMGGVWSFKTTGYRGKKTIFRVGVMHRTAEKPDVGGKGPTIKPLKNVGKKQSDGGVEYSTEKTKKKKRQTGGGVGTTCSEKHQKIRRKTTCHKQKTG